MTTPNTREGMERSAESLATLQSMYSGAFAKRLPERTTEEEKAARKDPLYPAHKAVEDVVTMLTLLAEESKFSPQELIYVTELVALNVQRADNCPLTQDQVEHIKKKAQAYYEAGKKLL